MGVADFFKSWKLREWLNLGFFVVSLAMLITGSVLMGIAISMANEMPPDMPTFDTPTCPTFSGTPKAVFTTSFAQGVAWSSDLSNPSSAAFTTLSTSLLANISHAWTSPKTQSYINNDAVLPPVISQINAFSQGTNGVNFYSEFIFLDASVLTNDVQTAIAGQGYPTNAFYSSTSQCSGLNPQSQPSTAATNSPSNPSGSPLIQGAYCDATTSTLLNIFVVDVSSPIIGTLQDKLAYLSAYLINAPTTINLQATWPTQEFRLVIYGGNEPIPLGRAKDQATWAKVVATLNSTSVNPLNHDDHSMEEALRYVMDNYVPVPGVATNVIVVTDGFDLTESVSASQVSAVLKNQYFYSVGVILTSTSKVTQNAIQPIASDFGHVYPIDNIGYLQNVAVQQTQAFWACNAFYPTPAPPTPAPTRIPLITTPTTPAVTSPRPTLNPSLPPVAACKQNVIFLIDQSQTMLSDGYTSAVQYAINMATTLSQTNSNSSFAYIVYNQVVVGQSNTYQDLLSFTNSLNNAPKMLGSSDYTVGFTAAMNFIQSNAAYDDDSTRSSMFLITDGTDTTSTSSAAVPTATKIRSQFETQIVGINVRETGQSQAVVQTVVEYNINDGYVPSLYVGVTQPSAIIDNKLMNSTVYQLQCKDFSSCNIDLTFVIENSEIQGSNYVLTQVQTVKNVISFFQGMVSPLKLSVSFIYFSSPDNLTPGQNGRSGIYFEQVTNAKQALGMLNNDDFSPYGAASDLDLGFNLTAQSLRHGVMQNEKLVIFFARGDYETYTNCCPDPSGNAATVRSLATVQGVTIGPYSNSQKLDALTGSNSIKANDLFVNLDLNTTAGRITASTKLADAIIPIVQNFISNQYCPGIPNYIDPPCEDPIDTLIMIHANDQNNWSSMLNFVSSQLIPDLLGSTGQPTNKTITGAFPVNIAIMSYYYLDIKVFADFTFLQSPNDYYLLVNTLPFYQTKGTATLSLAYKKAVEVFQDGRPFASKNIILITDTVDVADGENAFSEHDALVQQVGGYTSALSLQASNIPGADYQINIDAIELNRKNNYSLRQLANSLTLQTCKYRPLQVPTLPTPPPTPALPGPIPVVKAKNVWPDVTILIDTTSTDNSGMNAINFEKVRSFLDKLISQYSIGHKGSKFTIATFDGTTVEYSCKFIDVTNFYDLNTCRNEKLSLFSRSHSSVKNVQYALQNVTSAVYGSKSSGYRALNENFLITLTLGASTTNFQQELTNLQKQGVRTIGVGLSAVMTNSDISSFGQNNFLVPDWDSIYSGIDTNYDLIDNIMGLTTQKRSPSSSAFFANLIFVVDQSQDTQSDHQNTIQYVSNFVSAFLLGSVKTQVSIVPFANDVINPLPLASSQSTLDTYLQQWQSTSSAGSTSNIGSAIQYVSNMISKVNDRPNYVIYVIGASSTTGSETSKQLLKNGELYVMNYNPNANYASALVFNQANVFSVSSSQDLLNRVIPSSFASPNPVLSLIQSVYTDQQYQDSQNYPLSSIVADIIILLDETGLTDDDFTKMKQFLTSFTSLFHVDSQSTQFALQSYNGRTIPNDGFHLSDSTSGDAVNTRISQLTLAKATENSTDADLAGAIDQEFYYFLLEKNGWRDDTTTYTIIFSHADSFFERDTLTADQIKNVSSVFAVGTNGQRFDYVRNFTNTGFYETVDSVSVLSITSPAIADLQTTMVNDYKESIYPTPIKVNSIVKADFIFLVDNALGTASTSKVTNFLFDFMTNVGTFSNSGNDTKMAVVSYGKTVNVAWNLQSNQDATSLRSNIANFAITTSTQPSNLRSAIDEVILNENNFGVNPNRPTYFIVFAASPTISPVIDRRTTRNLNTRYSTFVIQNIDSQNTFNYVPSVLGTQSVSSRVVSDSNLKYADTQFETFNSWISSEFSAWTNTFPDKS